MDYASERARILAAKAAVPSIQPRQPFLVAFTSARGNPITLTHGSKSTADFIAPLTIGGLPIPFSHASIMVDLFEKVATKALDAAALAGMIAGLANSNTTFTFQSIEAILRAYQPQARPTAAAVGAAQRGSSRYAASHNSYDLAMDELFHLIFYIGLQEDFNYPGGRGRRLALERYAEAVHAGRAADLAMLEEAVRRAMNHGRSIPARWPGIDYGFS
ncbi:MAG: hypothetical protein AABX89_03835 [Candidatus Thermoplasmatota archaeon]